MHLIKMVSMIKKIAKSAGVCLTAAFFLMSCHNSEYAVSKSATRKPKFLEDIAIGAHDKSNVMNDGIDNSNGYSTALDHHYGPTNAGEQPYNRKKIDENTRHNSRIDPSVTNTVSEKYAGLLGVMSQQINNYSLYKFIDEWYGVNYRIGGSTKAGIDCSAFVQKLYSEVFGVDLFRTAMEQFNNCIRVRNLSEAEEGDLVFFHIHGRRISHVGIYLINDFFVHASRTQGIVISHLNEEYWHKYYAGVGRLPKG